MTTSADRVPNPAPTAVVETAGAVPGAGPATDAVVDVAVIGAGPAGLAAALTAGAAGLRVALIDAGVRPGGQFWRHPAARAGIFRPARLHHEWDRFSATLPELAAAGVARLAAHHVWRLEPVEDGWLIHCLVGGEPRQASATATVRSRRLILATGAYDRQLPFPGWELPGVMTAGGAQALLKGQLVVAGRRIVVAGSGPFLLPVAVGLARHGARVAAVVEANSPAGFVRSPAAVLAASSKLAEAAGYAAWLARYRIPVHHRWVVVRAEGSGALSQVVVAGLDRNGTLSARERTIACDVLAVGWGFTPQLELPLQAGCATELSDTSLVVSVDEQQRTSVPTVWAAGEVTGVGGADLAWVEGTLAGHSVVAALRGGRAADEAAGLQRRRRGLRRFAAALRRVYSVPAALVQDLSDATVVCRCEEVSAGRIRAAVTELGATDARAVKMLARPGMGWCQGRVCGYAVACLTAQAVHRPVSAADLAAFAGRPLATPVPLQVLADS